MKYEGTVFRPPSEARSLLIQATIGCAWNQCAFCSMYTDKTFRIRSLGEIERDLIECAQNADKYKRIFLCDGDAFVIDGPMLAEILAIIRRYYPGLQGVRAYAAARDVLSKTPRQLAEIRALGLDMVYIGLETGDDEILRRHNKGLTSDEMVKAAEMLKAAGIKQSISIIGGLGGEERWRQHATETARVLNRMQPEYLAMLVLAMGIDDRPLSRSPKSIEMLKRPDSLQVMRETKLMLENLALESCDFSSAHVSNYLNLKGHLPEDTGALLQTLDGVIAELTQISR